MEALIERREAGPAWMDKTSDQYAPDVEAAEAAAARIGLALELGAVIAKGDANGLCSFATVTDWDLVKRQPVDQKTTTALPRRAQTLAEVLMESVDGYPETSTQLIQLLLNACASSDTDLAMQAGALRDQLAAKWVEVQL